MHIDSVETVAYFRFSQMLGDYTAKSDLEHSARGAPARAESHPHFCGLCFVEWRYRMKSSLVVDISVIKNTNT